MTISRALNTRSDADRLAAATALVIGLGGLGSPAALALARAGVGTIRVVDPDRVEISNLPRQPLYTEEDVGRLKVDVAVERLPRLARGVRVEASPVRFTLEERQLLEGVHVVLDGTDSVTAKFAVNDAAVRAGVPLVHAGASDWRAQLTTVVAGIGACYRCVFEEPPPDADEVPCDRAGILGPAVVLAGTLQAAEAIRLLAGRAPALAGRLLTVDLRIAVWRSVPLARRPDCPVCGRVAASALSERSLSR